MLDSIDKVSLLNVLILFSRSADDPNEVLLVVKSGKIYMDRSFVHKNLSRGLRELYNSLERNLVCPVVFVHLNTTSFPTSFDFSF